MPGVVHVGGLGGGKRGKLIARPLPLKQRQAPPRADETRQARLRDLVARMNRRARPAQQSEDHENE